MKILILGGTGAMGQHLVKLLNTSENEIYITSRKQNKSDNSIHYILGNAQEISFLKKTLILKKWDVIVDFMVYSTNTFKDRYQKLLEATLHYIFLSSARVYANSSVALTENSPLLLNTEKDLNFLNTDEYSLAKARQENLLKQSNLNNWTIIRPYITYSENRLQLGTLEKEDWLYRALKGKTIVFSKDIASKLTTLTYGLDVSIAISKILNNEKVYGEVFHITSNKYISWGNILNIYLNELEKFLGYKPKIMLTDLKEYLYFAHSEYQIKYDRLYDRTFNNSKINKFVDYKNMTEIETGLINCLSRFLNNLTFKNINWRAEAIRDKLTNEKTPFYEITGLKNKIKYLIFRYFKLFND